jgi:hypothetical protein
MRSFFRDFPKSTCESYTLRDPIGVACSDYATEQRSKIGHTEDSARFGESWLCFGRFVG